MITRFQRALSAKPQAPSRFQRVLVTYSIDPANLDANRFKNQQKTSWWCRFINFGAFPPSPPSLAQNEAVFEACFGCQVWDLERALCKSDYILPIGGAHSHASQLGTDPMGWI